MTETGRHARPAAYYDDALADPASPHLLPNPDSPWHDLYRTVERILRRDDEPADVIDIGCGTGRLAALIDPVRHTTARYLGLDFSAAMLREATAYTQARGTQCEFRRFDATDPAQCRTVLADPNSTYILLELLEHLDDDLRLLSQIPAGARIIASVPSTDSDSHVRYFPRAHDALERYASGPWSVETWQRIPTPNGEGFWHLLTGTMQDTNRKD